MVSVLRMNVVAVTMAALGAVGTAAVPAAAQTTTTPVAQPDESSFLSTPAFAKMVKGKTLRITMLDGTRHEGRITQTPAGLTVSGGPSTPVPFDRIGSVEAVSKPVYKSAIKGAAIGFGVGLGLGLAATAGCAGDECEDSVGPALGLGLMTAGIGAGIAALVGLSHQHPAVIYQARNRKTVSFAPILSSSRKGMAFSMTWR